MVAGKDASGVGFGMDLKWGFGLRWIQGIILPIFLEYFF